MGVLCAAVAFTFITTFAGLRAHGSVIDDVDRWLRNSAGLVSGALCLVRVTLVRRDRLAWAVLGVGLVSYGTASVYYYTVVVKQNPPPYPSVSDIGWLAFYPMIAAAVILLLRSRVADFHPSLWADALIGALGVGALTSGLAATTISHVPNGDTSAVVVSVIYPLADLALLMLVTSAFGLMQWRPGPQWWLLGCALAGFAVADSYVLYRFATGGQPVGPVIGAVWQTSLLMPGFAALLPARERVHRQVAGWAVLVVPGTFAFAALGMLVAGTVVDLPEVTVALATATLLCVLFRAALTFSEIRQLARSRVEARTDDLTGLANRRAFGELLAARERNADSGAEPRQKFAVLVLDLDRFKEINDSLGHDIGDRVLVQVASRLSGAARPGEVLARMGGDEFAALLPAVDAAGAVEAAGRFRAALAPVLDIDGLALHVDASVGVAAHPEHGGGSTAILSRADVAMYAAKAGRTGVERFQPGSDAASLLRLNTVEDLHDALGRGALQVHYQMQVDLKSGRCDVVEALVRWQHPTRGLLTPDAFVPLAEHAGLMRPLSHEVIDMALSQCRAWWNAGLRVTVAVNLSASSLLDATLPVQVAEALRDHGLPPQALELEITETTLMLDHVRSRLVLDELRDVGVRLAVDDYGTGYSSLAYLRDFPVDVLKLDKTFVRGLNDDPVSMTLVRHTVDLAHALGMRIVVEGVEEAATVAHLIDLGCDYAQGYFVGRPEPADVITGKLRDRYPVRAGLYVAATSDG